MTEQIQRSAQVPEHLSGQRLDKVVAEVFDEFSRSRLQQWIKQGHLTVDGQSYRGRDKVYSQQHLDLQAELDEQGDWQAEPIALDIIYEDDSLLVLNKPVGLVVHPGAGNAEGTLVNALLHHAANLSQLPRAGIVHRLDKDTSGLMVVAKTLSAHHQLVAQLQQRQVTRIYQALVYGCVAAGGQVEEPIGRHPTQRTKMAVHPTGKPALTHYRVAERFQHFTHLYLKLATGRTHQIRVHMSHLNYPLIGDSVYGGRLRLPAGCSPALTETLRGFRRQALHAYQLGLTHPASEQAMSWQVDAPEDYQQLLQRLQQEDAEDESLPSR